MARYFFHVQDGTDYPDTVGSELPNIEAVRAEAMETSKQMVGMLGLTFWESGHPWKLTVVDEAGRTIMRLQLQGTIEVDPV